MIKFCHIAPTNYLKRFSSYNGAHLILAHLVEEDVNYKNFYKNLKDNKPKILDNSAFEMYKRKLPMLESSKLLNIGKELEVDYIVMSDYPNEFGSKTIKKAEELIPIFKREGFKTFFVPQSKINDKTDYIETFKWAINNDDVDLIGMSILGVPNAYGVEKDNKIQRYLSRYSMFKELKKLNILKNQYKKIHMLGMVDGPNEIDLVKEYHDYIFSWDSSSAIWAGINDILYDESPTGLIHGKFELEVDFDTHYQNDKEEIILKNIRKINEQL